MLRAMRRTSLAVVLASSAFAFAIAAAAPAFADPAPIIGGTATTLGQYPSVVVIQIGNGLCTGTLVTKDWVMTAGHCVTASEVGVSSQAQVTADIHVFFDTVNVDQSQGTVVTASSSLPDPAFDINNLGSHDIGLIKLSAPVTNITPVPINLNPANVGLGVTLTQVGFGATAVGGTGQVGVEHVVMVTTETCSDVGASDANLLCWSQTDGKGKCEGDSGGPSFLTINGVLTQVGETSFGDGGSGTSCSEFGTDTRIDAEKAFIVANIPELGCIKDGTCDAACGTGGLPTDPDCNPCTTDEQCTTGSAAVAGDICYEGTCTAGPTLAGGLGATCTKNGDCTLDSCGGEGSDLLCVAECTVGSASSCPSDFDCLSTSSTGSAGACWPSSGGGGGCCDAGSDGAPTALIGLALFGVVLRRARRV